MNLDVRLADVPLRRWHIELLKGLSSVPDLRVSVSGLSQQQSSAEDQRLERVLALERRLHNRHRGLSALIEPASLGDFAVESGATADLVLDLTAQPLNDNGALRLLFDGQPGEGAALKSLLNRRPPLVALVDSSGIALTEGRPGSESPGVLVAAFDDLLAGCLSLILGHVRSSPFAAPSLTNLEQAEPAPEPSLLHYAARRITYVFAHRVYRALYRAPHWRVGWRLLNGPGLIDDMERPNGGWRSLPDDGRHFYADPFPFIYEGRTYVFLEDHDHRIRRGVISVVEFDEHGPMHTPRKVLEHEVHLSYPFVMEHGGQVWMIPETSAAHKIELYRATSFPDRWACEAILVEGLEASDATIFWHGGRWWLTATVRNGGSFSDSLHLWWARELTGPWLPHPNNPVLLDISSARPAGRVVCRDGRLLRPVQDCRTGYGAALAVAEITQLDDQHFEQRVIGRLRPGDWWPSRRLHTLNCAGQLECIDGSAMSPRFWPRRPGM